MIRLLTVCGLGLFLAACAGMDSGTDQPFDKMIKKRTDLYRQGTGDLTVERTLEEGTRLRIIGISGDGFIQIETVSGEKGYVDRSAVGDQPWGIP